MKAKTKNLITYFEESVERNRDKVAISYKEQKYTYNEVDMYANWVANRLQELEVKENDKIVIITKRTIEMMYGIYGILKVGAAYVPLNPTHPINRNKYILEDINPNVVILGPGAQNYEIDENKYKVVNLLDAQPEDRREGQLSNMNHLTYVLYTSGTTGNPKGTLIRENSVINLIECMIKHGVEKEEVILQKMAYTFDFSVWEIFMWFFIDAKLVLLPEVMERNPGDIVDVIEKEKITRTSFVPSALDVCIPYFREKKPEKLKAIYTSGEALPVNLAKEFKKTFLNQVDIINSYGPTEATVFTSFYKVPDFENIKSMPIGKPMENEDKIKYVIGKLSNKTKEELDAVGNELAIEAHAIVLLKRV